MAGKTKEMSQIKQLLLLKKEGVSNRKAAAIVGINKETVNNYVKKALADELGIEGLLKLDGPVLEHRLKGGSPAYADKRFEVFKDLLPYLQEEMKRKHVTLKLLWEEYIQKHPDDHYSLTQFLFHYNQNTEAGKEPPSTILADMRTGGEKLFLDFTGDTKVRAMQKKSCRIFFSPTNIAHDQTLFPANRMYIIKLISDIRRKPSAGSIPRHSPPQLRGPKGRCAKKKEPTMQSELPD